MNYYQSVQRWSEGYAARVAEVLWPDLRVRQAVCKFLAEAIIRAGKGTTSWTVTLYRNDIRLNVGQVRFLYLDEDQVWFCALEILSSRPRWMHDCSTGDTVYPDSVNVRSREYRILPQNVSRIQAKFRAAAFDFIDEAASRRSGKSAFLKSHSPGVLLFLESFLKIDLPRPLGELPPPTFDDQGEEGELSMQLRKHKRRETKLRSAKLSAAISGSRDGRLRCEVPGCGFDFMAVYGAIGEGYSHVHHLLPLSESSKPVITKLTDLAIVCPNCHAMIHRGGKNRPLKGLIQNGKR